MYVESHPQVSYFLVKGVNIQLKSRFQRLNTNVVINDDYSLWKQLLALLASMDCF